MSDTAPIHKPRASLLIKLKSFLIYVVMVPAAFFANFFALVLNPFLPKSKLFHWVIGLFSFSIVHAARLICGVKFELIGKDNLPKDRRLGHVVMANHQSTWETFYLQLVFAPNTVILKRELVFIPFFGWALALMRPIFIDRNDKRSAMGQVLSKGVERLQAGEDILIFPEGTRMPVDHQKAFSKGGAVLAHKAGVDIIPVAHNAGLCWPARSFIKYPGLITVSVGPAISTKDRSYREALAEAENWVYQESRRLLAMQSKKLEEKLSNHNNDSGVCRFFH